MNLFTCILLTVSGESPIIVSGHQRTTGIPLSGRNVDAGFRKKKSSRIIMDAPNESSGFVSLVPVL